MKRLFIFGFYLIFGAAGLCLDARSQLNVHLKEKVDSLHKIGIDTIICYQPPASPTTEEVNDSCAMHERGYLIWRQGADIIILKEFKCTNLKTGRSYRIVRTSCQSDTFLILNYLSSAFN